MTKLKLQLKLLILSVGRISYHLRIHGENKKRESLRVYSKQVHKANTWKEDGEQIHKSIEIIGPCDKSIRVYWNILQGTKQQTTILVI